MPDVYDREIYRIVDADDPVREVYKSWGNARPLFQFATYDGRSHGDCGCITMIRRNRHSVAIAPSHEVDEAITAEIRADDSLPRSQIALFDAFRDAPDRAARVAVLTPFAEWQRRLDQRWNRKPPEGE